MDCLMGLEANDVRSLQALGALSYLKFDGYTIFQRAEAITLDGGIVDEDVLSGHPLDEAEALATVKPLHCTLFFFTQCTYSMFLRFCVLALHRL